MSKQIMSGLSVSDAFGFFKQVWGQGMASNTAPMIGNVEELDKHLANLKAVEQWLTLNLNMLQATIRGVEIHRATIDTFQSFGADVAGSFSDETKSSEATSANGQYSFDSQVSSLFNSNELSKVWVDNATAWWSLMTTQFDPLSLEKTSASSSQNESKKAKLGSDASFGNPPVTSSQSSLEQTQASGAILSEVSDGLRIEELADPFPSHVESK